MVKQKWTVEFVIDTEESGEFVLDYNSELYGFKEDGFVNWYLHDTYILFPWKIIKKELYEGPESGRVKLTTG